MNLKKFVLLLAVVAIVSVFLGGMQTVSAVTQSEIWVFKDGISNPAVLCGSDLDIKRGENLHLETELHFDGDCDAAFWRVLHFYVYNSQGELLINKTHMTVLGCVYFDIHCKEWGSGTYNVDIAYDGNKKQKIPGAEKVIQLHLNN